MKKTKKDRPMRFIVTCFLFLLAPAMAQAAAPDSIDVLWSTDANLVDAQDNIRNKNYTKALDILERMMARNFRNVDAYVMAATVHYNMKDYAKAKRTLTNALTIDRGHMGALVLMGYIALREDDQRQAEQYLNALRVVCGGDNCVEYRALKSAVKPEKD